MPSLRAAIDGEEANAMSENQSWMKCDVSLPEIQSGIFNAFEKVFTENNAPPEAALFYRAADAQTSTFLLSPGAARFAPSLPGRWQSCERPTSNKWSLSIGHHDALAKSRLDFGDGDRGGRNGNATNPKRSLTTSVA
jgi:hypothetical protein